MHVNNKLNAIILVSKERALKASVNDSIKKWTVNNCFSQSLFVAQFSIKILEKKSSNIKCVSKRYAA